MNTAEPRSKQKTMGDGAKGEDNYQESANKKTLNDRSITLSQKLEGAF